MLDAKQFPLIDVSEFPLVVDGRSIRTAKTEPISLDMCSDDARAFAACINSYVAHCGPNAIECAEGDLLGEMVEVARSHRKLCAMIAHHYDGCEADPTYIEVKAHIDSLAMAANAALAKLKGTT
jgi:hypothetical protein